MITSMMIRAESTSLRVRNHACLIDSTGKHTHTHRHTHTHERDKQFKSNGHIRRRAHNKERAVIGNAAEDKEVKKKGGDT